MDPFANGLLDFVPAEHQVWAAKRMTPGAPDRAGGAAAHPGPDAEALRRVAWEIGERRAVDSFTPAASHVGLAPVAPCQGFAHWRILPGWVEQTARQRGDGWHHCRPVLRLYDVSYIRFNGFNAHHIQDHTLPALCGQMFFRLPRPGTWELAEVGFLLRSGEFIPAARSRSVPFPPGTPSSRGDHAALYVDDRRRVEEVGNLWEQERILCERRRPHLRTPLRIAAFALGSSATGQDGVPARFVSELAAGQCAQGHEVHVFVPASDTFRADRQADGAHYHPLAVGPDGSPVERAQAFARAAEEHLAALPAFDLFHLHEWMAGLVRRPEGRPAVLSLSSVEATRRNGAPACTLSREVEEAERAAAGAVDCVLTPEWLRDRAAAELGLGNGRVRAFPMEGRLPNEWECPLDYGDVKRAIGFGPLDRLLLYVGPLEHGAGVDLLVEALPVLLRRAQPLRLAFAGAGPMHGHLEHRARELGAAHAVHVLGHVDRPLVVRLVRAAEALVLPSRYRVPFDDAVVDLARRAGRPVVTTHGGPAHLVRHEETGLVTYDNPGSMVWALDRILGDPGHAERMGRKGRRHSDSAPVWGEVARHYLELCTTCFPGLTQTQW
jgi:glycosyltransferase involved in cell wall biosynthesis